MNRFIGTVLNNKCIPTICRVRPVNPDVISFGDAPYSGFGEGYQFFQYVFHVPFHYGGVPAPGL